VPLLPLAAATVLEEGAGLFDFQLVQLGPADLLLSTGLPASAARLVLARARQALADFLAMQGAPGVRIRCRSGAPCPRGRSGKAKRVVGL
jgi:hypothetical protein